MPAKTVKKAPKKDSIAQSIKTVKTPEVNQFSDEDYIMCMSCTAGKLCYTGRRTDDTYIWDYYGETIPILYRDLRAEMANTRSSYIYTPLFLILNEEVYEPFDKVRELYETMPSNEAVERMIKKRSEKSIRTLVESFNNDRKEVLAHLIADYVAEGEITDYRRIKILSDVFGKDFTQAQT